MSKRVIQPGMRHVVLVLPYPHENIEGPNVDLAVRRRYGSPAYYAPSLDPNSPYSGSIMASGANPASVLSRVVRIEYAALVDDRGVVEVIDRDAYDEAESGASITECQECGRLWDDSITPAPSGRCPWERLHTMEIA